MLPSLFCYSNKALIVIIKMVNCIDPWFNYKVILGNFAVALGSMNEGEYLIRRFGSDRGPHKWYLLNLENAKRVALIYWWAILEE